MEVEIAVVAAELGRAIVQAMVSDAWTTLRPRLGRVLRRGQADHLVAALAPDAAALGAGNLSPEVAAGRWAGRIEGLLHQRPELTPELVEVLADVRAGGTAPRGAESAAPTVIRQATGNRSPAAAAGRDVVNSNNRTTSKRSTHFGGIGIVVAVVAVLLLVGGGVLIIRNVLVPAVTGSTIDADTPCAEYLQAPEWERDQAVRQMAVDMGVSGAGHPFLIFNVDDTCGRQPTTPVGEVVARQQY